MKELIKLTQQTLNNETVNAVSARELYDILGMDKSNWSRWYKKNIVDNPFAEEHVDWEGFVTMTNGNETLDFMLSLELAKKLAMQTRSQVGEDVRQYFIECEQQQADALKALANVTLDLSSNLVVYKDDDFYLSSLSIAKELGKRHKNVLRDIENEISQLKSEPADFDVILKGFKEITYLDEQGKPRKAYELNEIASYQILLRYSSKHRAMFLLQFKAMKDAVLNMYKLKVLDSVLPEYKGKRQYVYIIKNLDTGNVKVGVGTNPIKRLEQLQTGSDSELSLVYTSFLCSNAFSVEKEVHKHFKDKHVRGEWFKVSEKEVVNYLEQSKYSLSSNLDFSFDTKLKNLIKDGYDRNV